LIQIMGAHSRFVLLSRGKSEGGRVASYRVCFFNDIPRNERLFKCCQRSIVVRSADSPEQAVEAAKEQFERLEGIRDWRFHAARIEVEIMDENPVRAAVKQSMAVTDAGSGHRRNPPSQRV
jgi:hypothetical protein